MKINSVLEMKCLNCLKAGKLFVQANRYRIGISHARILSRSCSGNLPVNNQEVNFVLI